MFFAPPRAYSMYVLFGLFPPPPPSHLLLCLVFVLPPTFSRPFVSFDKLWYAWFACAPLPLIVLTCPPPPSPLSLLLLLCLQPSSWPPFPPFPSTFFCPGSVAPKKWALANVPWRRRFDNSRDNLRCQLPTVLRLKSTRGD